jgi:hypothetical protein
VVVDIELNFDSIAVSRALKTCATRNNMGYTLVEKYQEVAGNGLESSHISFL